jgi:hypothetical protein
LLAASHEKVTICTTQSTEKLGWKIEDDRREVTEESLFEISRQSTPKHKQWRTVGEFRVTYVT